MHLSRRPGRLGRLAGVHGQAGDAIPLEARIFAVCDALEAMTAPRPYSGPLAATRAYGRILAAAGRQFDPGVVDPLEHGVRDESLGLLRRLEPAAR